MIVVDVSNNASYDAVTEIIRPDWERCLVICPAMLLALLFMPRLRRRGIA